MEKMVLIPALRNATCHEIHDYKTQKVCTDNVVEGEGGPTNGAFGILGWETEFLDDTCCLYYQLVNY